MGEEISCRILPENVAYQRLHRPTPGQNRTHSTPSAHVTAWWALNNDTNVNPQTGLQYKIGNQYAYQYVCSDETTVYQTDGTINPNGATPVTNWTELQAK